MTANATRSVRRPGRRRALTLGAAAALAVAAAVVALLATRGAYDAVPRQKLDPLGLTVPAWTRPCWLLPSTPARRPETRACARVRGLVVYSERHDPDGDGDRHLIVLAHGHVLKVKVRRGVRPGPLPGAGHTFAGIGVVPAGHWHGLEVLNLER